MAMITTAIIAVAAYLIYLWTKKTLTYWKDRGIKGPSPLPLVGNLGPVLTVRESPGALVWKYYKQYPEEQAVGLYMGYQKNLLIRDPELLKHIFIKDFSTFQDRSAKLNKDDKFEDNLFSAEGETWRVLRHKLTPIFTSGKLKNMIPLIEKCIEDYISYVDELVDGQKDHEIRSLAAKYTLEVIGSCAFSVDMGTFTDSENIFYETANKLFSPSLFRKTLRLLDFFIPNLSKNMKKYLNISLFETSFRDLFIQLVNEIIEEREGKPKMRNDFMDLMIELKEQGKIEKKDENKTFELEMDTTLLAAQALIFFAAGFDTSSATMSFMMYELAQHPDIQQRVYDEVIAVAEKNNGKLTYESINDMTYLEMCFDETLRKYPVIPVLVRKCTENNYNIPDTTIKIEKNVSVMASVLGLQRDPLYFKDPEVFDPERFSEENKHSITRFTYLPFGDGPRNCIGKRFAKVQSMLGMATFLRKFKVDKSAKTPEKLEFDAASATLTSKDGIWLNIVRR